MLLHQLVDRFGPIIVFINVMGSALGLPVPAMPTMIIVGASIALMAVNGAAFWTPLLGVLAVAVAGGVRHCADRSPPHSSRARARCGCRRSPAAQPIRHGSA